MNLRLTKKEEGLLEWKKSKVEDVNWCLKTYMKIGNPLLLDHIKYHRGVLVEIEDRLRKLKHEQFGAN